MHETDEDYMAWLYFIRHSIPFEQIHCGYCGEPFRHRYTKRLIIRYCPVEKYAFGFWMK